jgi:hypothetical protein
MKHLQHNDKFTLFGFGYKSLSYVGKPYEERKMLRRIIVLSLLLILLCGMLITAASSNKNQSKSSEPLKITIVPYGPSQETIDAKKVSLLNNPSVKSYLKGTRVRVLSFELMDDNPRKTKDHAPPERFRAIIFCYDNNRALAAEGRFDSEKIKVTVLANQPEEFSDEEFKEAVDILTNDIYFGPLLRENSLKPYRPMPSISYAQQGNAVDRVVNVGLSSRDGSQSPEIVGVNMVHRKVERFGSGAPKTAIARPTACGLPNAGQSSTGRGASGQYLMTVSQGQTVVWSMTVIRPSASSGTRASAIELRDVDYMGKRVFGRAHVPTLNVEYVNGACGPYRDWQYQEGMLSATGTNIPNTNNSFRLCTSRPQTILDNATDTGNFLGVAVYTEGNETVLMSELEAGWYRYICEWHFYTDGSIQPVFGFGGVNNSCVCNDHNHHVYWRFDFDVSGASPNTVYGPGLRGWGSAFTTEIKLTRSIGADNTLHILNPATGDAYALIPGNKDGTAQSDPYARGDAWILRRDPNGGELDDGYNNTGGSGTAINMDQFVNGGSVQGTDVVVWYGAHFLHTVDDELSHKVGPQIIKVQ